MADNLAQVKALRACSWGDIDAFIQSHEIDDTRAYNLSKEAVIVETIATTEAFLAKGIRVNCVSPAAVSTGILDDFTKAFGPRLPKTLPARDARDIHRKSPM